MGSVPVSLQMLTKALDSRRERWCPPQHTHTWRFRALSGFPHQRGRGIQIRGSRAPRKMHIWPTLPAKSGLGRRSGWIRSSLPSFFFPRTQTSQSEALEISSEKCILQFRGFPGSWSPSTGVMDPTWQSTRWRDLRSSSSTSLRFMIYLIPAGL